MSLMVPSKIREEIVPATSTSMMVKGSSRSVPTDPEHAVVIYGIGASRSGTWATRNTATNCWRSTS